MVHLGFINRVPDQPKTAEFYVHLHTGLNK